MIDASKTYTTNNSGNLKIVKYYNYRNVIVEFINTKYVTKTTSEKIITGKIKDPLYPSRYDVGFIGVGNNKPSINGKVTRAFQAWCNMLTRCYSEKQRSSNPTYEDCTVCDQWHNFQNFADWFNDNYTEGLHLDKDIKFEGNKVYSPFTCLFVSSSDNIIKANAKTANMTSPEGVVVEFYNMSEFCRANGLDRSGAGKVLSGKAVSCKGWTKA